MKNKLAKLENFLQSRKQKFRENLPYLLLFFVIFLLLLAMHHLLAMYYDDFGNASLSYSQTSEDIIGTNYTLPQLWEWCKVIYMNWGGRILWAATILIPLLKFGAGIYFALQSVVITFIFYFIYKIAQHITKERHIFIPIVLFILYSLIHMNILRHGIYWASASILYIWPLLPLFAFIYLYLKLTEKIENKEKVKYWFYLPILLLLNFFATFSQEQIGVAMVSFLILFIVLKHGKSWKEYNILNIPNMIVCFISFAFIMLAPGNFVRLETNVEFASLSLFGKVMRNLPSLLLVIFRSEITIFMLIFTMVFIACLVKYRNELKISNKTIFLSNILFVIFSAIYVILRGKFKIVALLYGMVWMLYIGIWGLIYCYQRKKISIIPIIISGIGSMFCLVVSPVLGGRTALPFIFFAFLLTSIFTNEFLKESKLYVVLMVIMVIIPFVIKGINNYIKIYNGYLNNYNIEMLNYNILKKYDGTLEKEITLYKSWNTYYGVARSYEDSSIDYWIKEYFNIPQDVEFKWIDIYEEVRNEK